MGRTTQYKNTMYNGPVNKKTLDVCRAIARRYKVKVTFTETKQDGIFGFALCAKQQIVIKFSKKHTIRGFLSIFCHEIAHCLNYRNKKFFAFHSLQTLEGSTRRHIQLAIRTSLRAERYTDKQGRRLMKELFPGCRYIAFYNRQDMVEVHRLIVTDRLKDYLLTLDKK